MSYFTIRESSARRQFKKLLGHTNHFLITILIGLDSVADGTAMLSESFRTSWNPRSRRESSRRSRRFAIAASLSWCVDAVDAYLGLCLERPCLYEDENLRVAVRKGDRSVFKKLSAIQVHFPTLAPVESALVKLAIVWRNRVVHHLADNHLASETRETLFNGATYIQSNYRGLDITLALANSEQAPPTFKEMAALIAATQRFVQELDQALLRRLDVERFLADVLRAHFNDRDPEPPMRLRSAWNKDAARRTRTLAQLFQQYGASVSDDNLDLNRVPVELAARYAQLTYKDAVTELIAEDGAV